MSSLNKRRRYVASVFGGDDKTFTGNVVIDGNLTVIDQLTVKGPTELEGPLTTHPDTIDTFDGTSEFIGQVNMSNVGGHTLEVARVSNFFGAMTIENNLSLTEGGNLDVAGTSHLRGATEVGAVGANVNLTHNGTLRVRSDGNATLELLGTADNGTIETKGTDGITMRTEGGDIFIERTESEENNSAIELKNNDVGHSMFLQTKTEFGEILITRKDDLGAEICAIRMFSEAEVADSIILRVGPGTGVLTEDGWVANVPHTAPSFIPVATNAVPTTDDVGRLYLDDGTNSVTGDPAMRQAIGASNAYRDVMYHGDAFTASTATITTLNSTTVNATTVDADTGNIDDINAVGVTASGNIGCDTLLAATANVGQGNFSTEVNTFTVNTDDVDADHLNLNGSDTEPAPLIGRIYHDDGTNTYSGQPSPRMYLSSPINWADLALYAQGTWNPNLGNAAGSTFFTASTTQGIWIRFGNACFMQIYLAWTNTNGLTTEPLYMFGPFEGNATAAFGRQGLSVYLLTLSAAKSANESYQLQCVDGTQRYTLTRNTWSGASGNYDNVIANDLRSTSGVMQANGWFSGKSDTFP